VSTDVEVIAWLKKMPSNIREAVRKEISGIRWMSGWNRLSFVTGKRGEWPWISVDVYDGLKLPDGNYLLLDSGARQVYEVTPEGEIVWEFGEFRVEGSDLNHLSGILGSIDYNPERDTVLIGDSGNSRVLEVVRGEKIASRVLTKIDSGPLRRPKACYDPFDPDKIYIVEYSYHYVAQVDWKGKEYWSFGEWGVAGSDLSHLYWPQYISAETSTPDKVIIADFWNDRILQVNKPDNSVDWLMPIRRPRYARQAWNGHIGVATLSSEVPGWGGRGLGVVGTGGRLLWWNPYPAGNFCYVTHDMTVLFNSDGVNYEVDYLRQDFRSMIRPGGSRLPNLSLEADETGYGPPIIALPYSKVTLFVLSDQDATLYIDVVKPKYGCGSLFADPDDVWVEYDSVSLTGGSLEVYTFAAKIPVFRPRVKMGSSAGSVQMWYVFE